MAYDSKYTGEECMWEGAEEWPIEQFRKEYLRMLGFYNYYLGSKEYKTDILRWMKEKGRYSKEDIRYIDRAPDWCVSQTCGKLCRAINIGMPHKRVIELKETDPEIYIRGEISKALKDTQFITPDDEPEPTEEARLKQELSVQDRVRMKTQATIVADFDTMLDIWVKGADEVKGVSVCDRLAHHNIPAMGVKYAQEWIEKQLTELNGALNKECEELTEGYAYLSKKGLKNRIAILESMLADCLKFTHGKKAARKPRVKKPKAAEKQVSRLKYMQASADFGIKSISPMMIPASQRLFVFNTKYRVLFVYEASSSAGIEVKGASLKNINEKMSYAIKLRKPNDILPDIISKTPKQIDKLLLDIKGKRGKANGRINDQCVLLRSFAGKIL